jgi:hypothetical protein
LPRTGTLARLAFTKAPTAYGSWIRLMDDALTATPKFLRVSRNAEKPAELKLTGPEE